MRRPPLSVSLCPGGGHSSEKKLQCRKIQSALAVFYIRVQVYVSKIQSHTNTEYTQRALHFSALKLFFEECPLPDSDYNFLESVRHIPQSNILISMRNVLWKQLDWGLPCILINNIVNSHRDVKEIFIPLAFICYSQVTHSISTCPLALVVATAISMRWTLFCTYTEITKNSRPSPGNRNMFHVHRWDSSDFWFFPSPRPIIGGEIGIFQVPGPM